MANNSLILFIIISLYIDFSYPANFQQDKDDFSLGLAFFETGEYEKAKTLFALSEDQPRAKLYLARMEKDPSQAEKILTSLPFKPYEEAYYERYYLLGTLYFKQHNWSLAAECFEKALKKATWYEETLYYLAWSCFQQKDFAKAATLFEQLLNERPSEAALFALAQVHLTQGCYDKAAALLEKNGALISAKGAELAALFQLAASGKAPPETSSQGWLLLALKSYEEKEYGASQEALDRALLNAEDPRDILTWKGLISLEQKSLTALKSLKAQTDLQPRSEPLYYLIALVAANLKQTEIAEEALQKAGQDENTAYLKALIHFQAGDLQEALTSFSAFAARFPDSSLAGEALYWGARCQEKMGQNSKELLMRVIEKYPASKYAPEASFHLYSYREYMQGERPAIKHLQNFAEQYSSHPLALTAWHLLGLDWTRDRKTPEGKWIRRKNLHEAIDCFENFEKVYAKLNEAERSKELFYQTLFERGLLYYKMAEEAQGTKKQICLHYAIETLRKLNEEPIPSSLKEQSTYWLAKSLSSVSEDAAAQKVLNALISECLAPQSYFLAKAWHELGAIAFRQGDFDAALNHFMRAETTAFGLSQEERLEIWIDQSQCYKMLGQLNQAMLTLSQVINDDAISGLRLKAMYLRAEIYEKQGRLDLARKQLEATAQKGGEWGGKAVAKLEKEYGY